jgi:GTP-binding protein
LPIRCVPSEVKEAIEAQPIDPPTLSMTFRINDGPLAGKEGDKVQSRVIRDRLMKEAEGNVALQGAKTCDGEAVRGCRPRRAAAVYP